MDTSTWLMPLIGGALIGLSAALMMFLHGRIAGISGIFGGLITGDAQGEDRPWRLAFTGGLLAGGALWLALDPGQFAMTLDRSLGAIAVAGLLVGFGTRMGNGCTSGHGVCGLTRLSRRSMVATGVFMTTGALAVLVVQRGFGGAI